MLLKVATTRMPVWTASPITGTWMIFSIGGVAVGSTTKPTSTVALRNRVVLSSAGLKRTFSAPSPSCSPGISVTGNIDGSLKPTTENAPASRPLTVTVVTLTPQSVSALTISSAFSDPQGPMRAMTVGGNAILGVTLRLPVTSATLPITPALAVTPSAVSTTRVAARVPMAVGVNRIVIGKHSDPGSRTTGPTGGPTIWKSLVGGWKWMPPGGIVAGHSPTLQMFTTCCAEANAFGQTSSNRMIPGEI